ncbi:MAG TPA: AsmA family protein [Candidatus Binataceae bacterium]|nr:AsmA family protein [Candidatus Binataceae bacterium]
MRKPLIIIGAIVGGIVVAVGAILIYAAANLNSIIASNRDRVLAKVSASLGRSVHVESIKAQLGWGVEADLSGVEIGDDPGFSVKPFVTASDLYAQVDLIPLLARQLRITKVVLSRPRITVIRNADGQLNVLSIGKKSAQPAGEGAAASGAPASESASGGSIRGAPMAQAQSNAKRRDERLEALHVSSFAIDQGTIIYQDAGQPPLEISQIDFDLENFSFNSAFKIDLKMAAIAAGAQNLELSGQVGPLLSGTSIDVNAIPLDLKLTAGPFALADFRKIEQARRAIPAKLAITDTVSLTATVKGRLDALALHGAADLSADQVSFGDLFVKPAGTALKLEADADRDGSKLDLTLAQVTLDVLDLKATKIAFGGGSFNGRIDTNQFDIGALAKLAPAAAKLAVTGKAEIHTDVQYADGKAAANGVVALGSVSIPKPGAQPGAVSAVSNLSGNIKLAGTTADIGPLTFTLGAANATLKAHADPIYPPKLTYDLTADAIHTADFAPGRPADEQLNNLTATGTLSLKAFGVDDENKLLSPSGLLNNVAYKNLELTTSLEGKRLRVVELKLAAFNGQIAATAETHLAPAAPFNTSLALANVDVQQALASQKAKAADKVRGLLTGNLQLSGTTGKFDDIKQTLEGNGKIVLMQGKLVGINVAATALKKVDKLPGIGNLVPQSVVNNHPELFSNPDTDIQSASLSFVLKNTRVTSNDILVKTVDYSLTGDGWVAMDRHIDMAARIILTQELTKEIVAHKQAVIYVTNKNEQVDLPMRITGQLPKPIVVPNVADLAQHAGQRALQQQGSKALGKFLGNKGLGGFLGGGNSGSGSSPNPLGNLKNLF